jgi:hypothetical protein
MAQDGVTPRSRGQNAGKRRFAGFLALATNQTFCICVTLRELILELGTEIAFGPMHAKAKGGGTRRVGIRWVAKGFG